MKIISFLVLFCSFSAFGAPMQIHLQYKNVLVKRGFASPVVSISINGKSGLFLVDSGASTTVISKWFAEKARIVTTGQGHVGGSSGGSSQTSVGTADLLLKSSRGAVSFKEQSVVIVSLPDVFKENDIAGILSPQQLLNDREIGVLNLTENASFKINNDFSKLNEPSFPLNVISAIGPGGSKTTLFSIDAIVGDTKATFIVDTGADGAGIGSKTYIGDKLLPQSISTSERVGGINGTPEEVRIVPRATVKLLGRNFEMKIRLQPISNGMPADGMLGMQFLRNCSLLLSSTRGSIFCP